MSNAEEVYADLMQQMPASERLKLAVLIPNDLSNVLDTVDYSHEWS